MSFLVLFCHYLHLSDEKCLLCDAIIACSIGRGKLHNSPWLWEITALWCLWQ